MSTSFGAPVRARAWWILIGLAAGVATWTGTSTPAALAFNGGDTWGRAVPVSCAAPCEFTADTSGEGLADFSGGTLVHHQVTWFSFDAATSGVHTFRVISVDPAAWDNTLVLVDDTGAVVAESDDVYGLDAMISPTLTVGSNYRLGVGGFSATSQGTANVTMSASPPDAPRDVAASAGDSSASITWTAPFDNDAAIIEYRVHVNGAAEYTAVTGTPPVTSALLTGLTNGASYTFQVSAVNGNGEGAWSVATTAVTPFGPTVTTVTFSPANPVYPATFDVIATVTASAVVDSGSVDFVRDGVLLATIAVHNGVATLSRQSMPPGIYNYKANYSGSGIFESSGSLAPVTVAKATQTITFASPGNQAFASGPLTVAPSASSGLPVTLSSTTKTVCNVVGFTVSFGTGGLCSLVAAQAGNLDVAAATSVQRTFQVTGAPQTITFAAPANRTWSAGTFSVSATSSVGLAVAIGSSTTSVCTIASGTVTMVRSGTCTLTATQAGNLNFAAAADVVRTFDIAPAAQAAFTASVADTRLSPGSSTPLSASGGSGTGAVSYVVSSGVDTCAVSGTSLVAIGGGTCVVTATKAGDERYAAITADTATITVVRYTPVVHVQGGTTVRPGHTVEITVEVTGLAVGHTSALVYPQLAGATHLATVEPAAATPVLAEDGLSGTATFTVTGGDEGTLSIGASLAATTDYEAATEATPHAVLVARAPQTITFARPADRTWTVDALTLDASSDAGLAVTFHSDTLDVCTVDGSTLTMVAPGDCTVRAAQSGTFDTAPAADVVQTFAIATPPTTTTTTATTTTATTTTTTTTTTTVPTTTTPTTVPTPTTTTTTTTTTTIVPTTTTGALATPSFVAVPVVRLIDTRPGRAHLLPSPSAPLRAGAVLTVHVADPSAPDPSATDPSALDAVALHITVAARNRGGTLSVYSCGPRPATITLAFAAGQTVANSTIVGADAAGNVCLVATAPVHVTVDLAGRLPATAGFHPTTPMRVLDTRPGTAAERSVATTKLTAGSSFAVQVTDLLGHVSPQRVSAVVMNLTVVAPERSGWVAVHRCGEAPATAHVTFVRGQTASNMVVVPVDTSGSVCISTSARTHLAADLSGWYDDTAQFTADGTTSLADERIVVRPRRTTTIRLHTPGAAGAVALAVTVSAAAGTGSVSVHACDALPLSANLYHVRNRTAVATAIVPVDESGDVCLTATTTARVSVDVVGWFGVASR